MTEIILRESYKVVLYNSSSEMPMDLYFQLGQFGLLDYEVGSEMSSVDRKFAKLDSFLMAKQWEQAVEERRNLHQTFWSILNRIHYPSLQFGCYIHSVNGVVVEDYSENNLMKIMTEMGKHGFTLQMLRDTLELQKKNFERNLN